MTGSRRRHRKMDPHLVSSQKWEVQHIADKFNVSVRFVREVVRRVGRSRRRVYAELRA